MSGTARSLLFLGVGVGLFCGLTFAWGPETSQLHNPEHLRLFTIFLVPHLAYLFLLVCLFTHADRGALAIAAGMGVVPLLILPLFFFFSLAAGMLGGGHTDQETMSAIFSFIPGAIFLNVGWMAGLAQSKERRSLAGALFGGVVGTLVLFMIDISAWSTPPDYQAIADKAEQDTSTLVHMSACNQLFAQQGEKGFAANLADLGPAGTKCLSATEISASQDKDGIKYEPGTLVDGRISTYRIVNNPRFLQHMSHTETDQSGIVIDRGNDGHWSWPYGYLANNIGFLDELAYYCLFKDYKVPEYFPEHLQAARECLARHDFVSVDEDTVEMRRPRYRITYFPVVQPRTHKIVDFILSARPVDYGRDGVRSFEMSKDRVVHVTAAPRRAEQTDPDIRVLDRAYH